MLSNLYTLLCAPENREYGTEMAKILREGCVCLVEGQRS